LRAVPDVILLCGAEVEPIELALERLPAGFNPVLVQDALPLRGLDLPLGGRQLQAPEGDRWRALRAGLEMTQAGVVCVMTPSPALHPQHLKRVVLPLLEHEADLVLCEIRSPLGLLPASRRLTARGLLSLSAGTRGALTDLVAESPRAGLVAAVARLGLRVATVRVHESSAVTPAAA
jgi:hypothetical protein